MTCPICLELFKQLCYIERSPLQCKIYEDYATGRIDGELPLEYAIRTCSGWAYKQAIDSLVERGIYRDIGSRTEATRE